MAAASSHLAAASQLSAPLAHDIERVLVDGDLSALTAAQRVSYYRKTCESLGLNPLTKPLAYIKLNGKLVLYALRDCTDQLRARNKVSITIVGREVIGDVYVVTARAQQGERMDESTGAVPIVGLKGEALANAYMKTETKAKRRVTLSICGLGLMDETEVSSVPAAKRVTVTDDGEILEPKPALSAEQLEEKLINIQAEIDRQETLDELVALYNSVIQDASIPEKEKMQIKLACSIKRNQLQQATESSVANIRVAT